MKYLIILFSMLLWACAGNNDQKAHETHGHHHTTEAPNGDGESQPPKSPKQVAMTNIGSNHVHIEYSSPSKRGRLIFGGLVAFGEVWVTGAHKATTINFSHNVKIGATTMEKGKYALFTIPGEHEWTIIINSHWDQHLADEYSAADDLVRLAVKPQTLEQPVESLTFEITAFDENAGEIVIKWDTTAVSFEVINA